MKRKIAISCYPSVGGSGVIATELGKALAERGHEVHFITFDVPFRLDRVYANVFYHEVEVNQYSVFKFPPYDLTLASKIAEVVKREGIELIHAHYAVPHAICAYLAKQMVGEQLKIITTLHGTDITVLGYDQTLSEMIRLGIEQSDTVTAVSNDLVSQTKELLQTTRPIDTIYNFVDERFYYKKEINDLKKAYHIQEDEKVMIHISNFRPVKRVTDIIRSFALIRKQVKAKLILLGDGPERSIAGKLAQELEISADVLFLGSQNQVADFLAISDLKLLLSEKESFGLVALEAMACEVPVIATNIGGIPEVVVDGETGYLCELGDIETVAERAIELLLDEKRRIEMGKRARERVESHFSLEKIVSQYEDLYERTLMK